MQIAATNAGGFHAQQGLSTHRRAGMSDAFNAQVFRPMQARSEHVV